MLITARKRSLGQGNIFTPVCHSVHRGGCLVPGGCLLPGVSALGGGSAPRGGAWSEGDVCSGGLPGPGGVPGPRGVSALGGTQSQGVPGPGGDAQSWGRPGRDPPPDGYCCRWYASYWNAFLFTIISKN